MSAKERLEYLTRVITGEEKEKAYTFVDGVAVEYERQVEINTKLKSIDLMNKMTGEYVTKVDKRLQPTALGEVVTGLMMERFNDIIDVEFTANMESRLDDVEAGRQNWKDLLADFYKGFHQEMLDAEAALEGTRLKVPDEVSEEICEVCGRNMVVKIGRFGKFLACPGFPECKNTKPIVEKMPGRCPSAAVPS